MNKFQREVDAASERARRFFADVRDADRRRPGELANAALSLSETLISLAFRSERSSASSVDASQENADASPRLAVFSPETPSASEPTILRFDAFRRSTRPEPRRVPTLPLFAADAPPERAATFPRLFVPAEERPRLRVVAAD